VQILSDSDFEPSELGTAARVLRRSGAIVIFSVSSQKGRRDEIEKLFGKEQFFEPLDQPHDSEISQMVINHLHQLQRREA
jgi:hypothetical protein